MKKVLLGGTALAAAGLLAMPASAADVSSGLSLKISGFVGFQAGLNLTDSDHSNLDRDYDFQSNARIVFDIKNVTDSGLEYGGRIRLNSVNRKDNVQVTRVYGYVRGEFGTITFGNAPLASADIGYVYAHDELAGQRGSGGMGYGDLLDTYGIFAGGGQFFSIDPTYISGISNQDTRIKYTSPNISGFTFALDFTPVVGGASHAGNGGRNDLYNDDKTLYENVVSGGIRYEQDFSGVSLRLAGTATYGSGVKTTLSGDNPNGNDAQIYTLGAQVGSGGIYGSVNWVHNESVAIAEKPVDTVIGDISYTFGPWLASVSYAYTWSERGNGLNSSYTSGRDLQDNHVAGANLTYTVAPGLNTYAEVTYEKQNFRTGRDFESANLVTGLLLAF